MRTMLTLAFAAAATVSLAFATPALARMGHGFGGHSFGMHHSFGGHSFHGGFSRGFAFHRGFHREFHHHGFGVAPFIAGAVIAAPFAYGAYENSCWQWDPYAGQNVWVCGPDY